MFPRALETDRLRLERLSRETVTVEEYHELWATANPAVFEQLTATPFDTLKEAADELDDAEAHWAAGETAAYAVRPADGQPDAGELVGRTSLSCDWERQVGDLGCMLDAPHWGRGYADECAAALTRLAVDRLGLAVVTVDHVEGNDRSRRAIEKYVDAHGGQHDGVTRAAPGGELETRHHYSVTAEEYDAAVD